MSRSGYHDDGDYLNLYRASVERAISGRRGQKFLRELAAAMDAMPVKRLIADELVTSDGEMCTIGVVCKARGIDVKGVDVTDADRVGQLVDISRSMAAEIEYMNDEYAERWDGARFETPEQRWVRMRKWVDENLIKLGREAAP